MGIQTTPENTPSVQLPEPGVPHASDVQQAETDAHRSHLERRESDLANADLHLWWKEGSQGSYTNVYSHVAVLLINWREDLDELKCSAEVQKLEELFREKFKYDTTMVQLHNDKNVDLQLSRHIGTFVMDNDRPGSLLIVYYSGHGSYELAPGHLVLHPRSDSQEALDVTQSKHQIQAVWEDAEQHLMKHTNCDVLSILDCCFAGNVHKGGFLNNERTYQLLSAGDKDQITQRPGALSFTTALIESLSELLEERQGKAFSTTKLREHIAEKGSRSRNPPRLVDRLKTHNQHIFLMPLGQQHEKPSLSIEPSQAFLTVRLALSQKSLDEHQVKSLAETMTKVGKAADVKVQRVDLLNFSRSTRSGSLLQMVKKNTLPAVRLRQGALKHGVNDPQIASGSRTPTTFTNSGLETPADRQNPGAHLDVLVCEEGKHSLLHASKKRKRPFTPESSERSPGSFQEG